MAWTGYHGHILVGHSKSFVNIADWNSVVFGNNSFDGSDNFLGTDIWKRKFVKSVYHKSRRNSKDQDVRIISYFLDIGRNVEFRNIILNPLQVFWIMSISVKVLTALSLLIHQLISEVFSESIFTIADAQLPLPSTPILCTVSKGLFRIWRKYRRRLLYPSGLSHFCLLGE